MYCIFEILNNKTRRQQKLKAFETAHSLKNDKRQNSRKKIINTGATK